MNLHQGARLGSLLIIILTATFPLAAQYQGPGSKPAAYTVSTVQKQASKLDRLDVLVRLQGHLVQKQSHDDYIFRDSTGIIRVEIPARLLPEQAFDEKALITLEGEVDYDWLGGTEIEVKSVWLSKD